MCNTKNIFWRIKSTKQSKQKKKKKIQTQNGVLAYSAGTQVFTKMYISAEPELKALTVWQDVEDYLKNLKKRWGTKTEDAWLERQKCRRADWVGVELERRFLEEPRGTISGNKQEGMKRRMKRQPFE